MKKINKIVLSVFCVAVAAVMFHMGQQRSLVNAFVSSNVEALVTEEIVNGLKYFDRTVYRGLYDGPHVGYTSTNGELITGNDMWWCWQSSSHNNVSKGICWQYEGFIKDGGESGFH